MYPRKCFLSIAQRDFFLGSGDEDRVVTAKKTSFASASVSRAALKFDKFYETFAIKCNYRSAIELLLAPLSNRTSFNNFVFIIGSLFIGQRKKNTVKTDFALVPRLFDTRDRVKI